MLPYIRVYVDPKITKDITSSIKDELSFELRLKVAYCLNLYFEKIGVLWISVEHANNVAPLNIEVVYSEDTTFDIAEELAALVASLDWLPECITKFTILTQPQHDAVLKVYIGPHLEIP